MSTPKTIRRLIACHGSIQLVTVLSVLSYREEEQREPNLKYENYLVITPVSAPEGQTGEFVEFIEKMARSVYSWERAVYISYEQVTSIAKSFNSLGLSRVSDMIHKLLGIERPDEIYLSREWRPENQILMSVYESAEKICYGDGIGFYLSQSTFPPARPKNPKSLKVAYESLRNKLKIFLKDKLKIPASKKLLSNKEFDIGYFSLPYAYSELPPMKTVILDSTVYLQTFQKLRKTLSNLTDINYINDLRARIQDAPTSILLTSNFSEAAGRMSLENEIAAYKEFLKTQEILSNSVLLIKPHPRDSNFKILKLQNALSELYLDILLLNEKFLFYLPFELFFMEVFLGPDQTEIQRDQDQTEIQNPKIFTFSSACLTLTLLFNVQCIIGFGSDIVNNFFYEEHCSSRIEHEADLLSTTQNIRRSKA